MLFYKIVCKDSSFCLINQGNCRLLGGKYIFFVDLAQKSAFLAILRLNYSAFIDSTGLLVAALKLRTTTIARVTMRTMSRAKAKTHQLMAVR